MRISLDMLGSFDIPISPVFSSVGLLGFRPGFSWVGFARPLPRTTRSSVALWQLSHCDCHRRSAGRETSVIPLHDDGSGRCTYVEILRTVALVSSHRQASQQLTAGATSIEAFPH